MQYKLCDRVKQTTATTGTGDYTLIATTETNMQNFGDCFADGESTTYCRVSSTDFELGIGVLGNEGTTISRSQILSSSNSGNAVDWAAGEDVIFCSVPAAFIPRIGFQDPAIDENPGVRGAMFINCTTGEIFVCTNPLHGDNVWYGTDGTVIVSSPP